MATLQRFQNHGSLLALARLSVALVLVLGASGCKKAPPADAKKPPIVKAKKPGADVKGADDPKAKGDAAAKPTVVPGVVSQRPAGAPEAPTPTVPPAVAPAPAAAPVVPIPVGRAGRPVAEIVAKADPAKPDAAKAELAKPDAAKAEPAKPAHPEAPAKADEPALPPGAVTVHATPTEPPLDVNGYIIAADLPKVLGTKQKFHRTELVGINPSANYNAMFYAADKQDLFGVSVQVWRDPNLAESRTRFNTMKNSYSNVTPTNKVTDMGFRSYYGNVVTLVFVDPRRPLLAAISCSTKVCSGDQMIELARRVAERLH